ncbi:glycosyltransferase family 2 protein [Spirosoma aerolatum]|uniref:glycosyltransferase family 2 protein n=1 Tax=Spirosoma aerolatum TaxID=1211326 RepID=UPI0009ACAC54|nr:glycosyltransferase family 2 protein [Spirosoma aerolatum]
MSRPPKLSIITINYNNAQGLRKTIESVVSQTSPEFEYLVIDGGSIDGSVDIIKKYEKSISYWISEKDKGIYHAMNKGILQAKGEYCQFLNSGDYLLANNVTELMLEDMPECNILYGNKLRDFNGISKVEKSFEGRQITLLDMFMSTFFHSPAYIKKSLFETYGLYDETLKIVSDWKFYLISIGMNNEKVAYRDIDLVWFDSNGISTTNKDLDTIERSRVLEEVIPRSILLDYQQFAKDSLIIKRIKQNKLAWFIVINLYRLLFRFDKYIIKK